MFEKLKPKIVWHFCVEKMIHRLSEYLLIRFLSINDLLLLKLCFSFALLKHFFSLQTLLFYLRLSRFTQCELFYETVNQFVTYI